MKIITVWVIAVLLALPLYAETFSISLENGRVAKRFPEGTRPVVGLALSGGGAARDVPFGNGKGDTWGRKVARQANRRLRPPDGTASPRLLSWRRNRKLVGDAVDDVQVVMASLLRRARRTRLRPESGRRSSTRA